MALRVLWFETVPKKKGDIPEIVESNTFYQNTLRGEPLKFMEKGLSRGFRVEVYRKEDY